MRGVLGVAAWPAEAVARPAGAAAATPRVPSSLSSAAVAAAGEAPVARAGSKWTKTSLTSKEMFFLLRYSIQTVVYLGTKLPGGSQESLDAANPFQRTLYSLPPGVPGSGLSVRILSAVKSSSSPSSSGSRSPAVNSKVTGRPPGSGARGRSWVWSRSRILLSPT